MSETADAQRGAGSGGRREGEITVKQAAKLLMVSEAWVHELVKRGYIRKGGRGRYPLVSVVQGYIRHLKEGERRGVASKQRLMDLKAEEIELKIEKESGAFIAEAVEEAVAYVDEIVGPLKVALLAIPARVTDDLALRRRIEGEIDDAFREAANRAEDRLSGIREAEPDPNAGGEDESGRVGAEE